MWSSVGKRENGSPIKVVVYPVIEALLMMYEIPHGSGMIFRIFLMKKNIFGQLSRINREFILFLFSGIRFTPSFINRKNSILPVGFILEFRPFSAYMSRHG